MTSSPSTDMNHYRKFGLTVGGAFLVLAGILWWRDHLIACLVVAGVGGVLIVMGLVTPAALAPVERGWMVMAHAISKVTTPIIMGLVYYLSVAPIGLVMRAIGRNPISVSDRDGSFWHDRQAEGAVQSDLERQF